MLHKAVKLLAVLCVSQAFTARPQQASPPPTLEATTKWLTDKLNYTVTEYHYDVMNGDGTRDKYRSTLKQTLTTDSCRGHFVIHEHSEYWDRDASEWKENQDHDVGAVTFEAKYLLPREAKLTRWDQRYGKEFQQTSTPTVYDFLIPGYVEFVLIDPDLAPRIQKAITGWSHLCGATDEPY